MIDTMIFDFNGTMIFDGLIQKRAWGKFLEVEFNRELTSQDYQLHIAGINNRNTFEYYLDRSISDTELAQLSDKKENIYREICLNTPDEFQLVPGLSDFLDWCKNNNIKLNIATASEHSNVIFFFNQLRLGRWFDLEKVAFNDGKIKGKPAPDIFLKAIENLGGKASSSAIFEDSVSGIQAANKAQAGKVVLVEDPKLEKVSLPENLRIDKLIQEYSDINKFFQE
ncbi:HAD family hydrolase [Companilactobacillus futsaii]|uniref:HAD family hydrolase n=2 Tax=Companilactobacillus futsaii TaxID=938155 RepID=A0A5B7T208_9LACO|nr:HAD-IA family hydrolase [Companilactobacillus futsaii]KRK90785.1 beta-phosphoglucomutase [Companilactobacillus futsaii JCM 17355]QCX25813.1 HAD family hydrolase [Companilactobacillus futsaii]